MTFYAAFELQNLCVYALLAITSRKVSFYSLRYFFLSAFISFIILYYLLIVLYFNQSIDISVIPNVESKINNILLVVFTFKFGIFPFTFWLVDFYKNFSNASLSFFVAITKVPLFVIFARFSDYMDINEYFIVYLVISFLFSFISMLSNLKNTPKFFAYSSSNTMVFLLLYIFVGPGIDLYTYIYFFYYITSLCLLFKFVNLNNIGSGVVLVSLLFLLFGLPFSFIFFVKLYMLNELYTYLSMYKFLSFLVIYILSSIPYFFFIFNCSFSNNVFTVKNKYDLNIIIGYIILSLLLAFLF